MIEKNRQSEGAFSPSLLLIVCSCLCVLIQLIALPYRIESLMALSNRVLMVVWFLGVGFVLFCRFSKPVSQKMGSILLVLSLSLLAWLVAALEKPGMAMDNLMATIGFLLLPMMLCYAAFFEIDERAKTVVCTSAILYSVLFIWLYHSDKRHVFEGPYGIEQVEAVTLGYANPNQTAMYLFLCVVTLFCAFFYFKSRLLKLLVAADGCYILWILQQTESRTAILLFAMFAVLALLMRKRDIPSFIIGLSVLLPVIYILLIPLIANSGYEISFMGENIFTGRENIFDRYFQSLNIVSLFFGNMNEFQFANLHNGYIAVAASVGAITCLSYIVCIKTSLIGNCPDEHTPTYARVAFFAFLCVIAYTSSEAAFLVGGSNFAFMVFSIVVLFANPFATSCQTERNTICG